MRWSLYDAHNNPEGCLMIDEQTQRELDALSKAADVLIDANLMSDAEPIMRRYHTLYASATTVMA